MAISRDLASQLGELHAGVLEGLNRIEAYVNLTRRGIESQLKTFGEIRAKFAAALAGEEDPNPVSEDQGVTVTFSHDEAAALTDYVSSYHAMVEHDFPELSFNLALIYLVAIFEAFIADSLRTVLRSKPKMLRLQRQVSYEVALSFPDRVTLVEHLADREIADLTYKAFADQLAAYRARFSVDLSEAGVDVQALAELMARRNLLVHNNGTVNRTYLQLVRTTPLKLGEVVKPSDEYWGAAVANIRSAVSAFYDQLSAKFASTGRGPRQAPNESSRRSG